MSSSSSAQPMPKKKNARGHRDRKAYFNRRDLDNRIAECDAAGVPYTKHLKVVIAAAQLSEQCRKAARQDEHEETRAREVPLMMAVLSSADTEMQKKKRRRKEGKQT